MKLPVDYNKTNPKKRRLVRLAYIKQQEGKCCHCGMPLEGTPANEVMVLPVDGDGILGVTLVPKKAEHQKNRPRVC